MIEILSDDETLERGIAALTARDPIMARLVEEGARPSLRRRAPGFEGLAWIVVGQQLSVASANAIYGRLLEAVRPFKPDVLAQASDEALRKAGLSAPKIRTLRSVAEATMGDTLPLDALHACEADEAHRLLTGVRGIGPWTADIYLLFCLGHADAFPAGDLAVQESARLAYGLQARPREKEMLAIAECWRPWRGVGAKILWAHYRIAKSRSGAPMEDQGGEAA